MSHSYSKPLEEVNCLVPEVM